MRHQISYSKLRVSHWQGNWRYPRGFRFSEKRQTASKVALIPLIALLFGELEASAYPGILSRMRLSDEDHRRSFLNLFFEVALITVGVFLALWANNWHEDREHRALGQAALRNFAGEMEANRVAKQSYRQYHETLARELHEFLARKEPPSDDRFNKSVHFEGMRPMVFEHTAWDLALATQALSWLKPDLAFDISKSIPSKMVSRSWKTVSSPPPLRGPVCRATISKTLPPPWNSTSST